MSALYCIVALPTIEHFFKYMKEHYPYDISTVFVFVWANKKYPQSAESLLENSEYINIRSNKYIDFFYPGYDIETSANFDDENFKVLTERVFIMSDFIRSIETIENMSKWRYSGNAELLILEYYHGKIKFDKAISINLDKLLSDNIIFSVNSFIEDIIRIAKSCNTTSEFSHKLNYSEAKLSIQDAIKKYLSDKLNGTHIGTFLCQNLETNT